MAPPLGGRSALTAAWLALCCLGVQAHDSWLGGGRADAGVIALGLSTGTRYPAASSAPPADSLSQAACTDARDRVAALRPRAGPALVLPLRARVNSDGPLACWAELRPLDITLAPPLVELYLRETRPAPAVRARWADLIGQGLPWQERYRKFARIELAGRDDTPRQLRAVRAPRGLDLEIVVLGDAPLKAGRPAVFEVLSRGEPVRGLSVELVSERSPLGVWARSDQHGRLHHTLPFGGWWLLRATLIEPAAQGPGWQSRFVTLAFEAQG